MRHGQALEGVVDIGVMKRHTTALGRPEKALPFFRHLQEHVVDDLQGGGIAGSGHVFRWGPLEFTNCLPEVVELLSHVRAIGLPAPPACRMAD